MSILINDVKVDLDHTLTYKPNPKRPGFKAHARYELYQNVKTVRDYLDTVDKKYAMADLRYDEAKGYIEIHNTDGTLINPKTN